MEINKNEWADYVANFTEEIRSAFPDDEIAHNSVWFHVDPDDPYLSPYLDRQVDAADYIGLERGVNDPGIKAGTHPLGIVGFLEFNDYLHERGRKTVHYVHINKLANNGKFSQDNPVLAQALLPPLNQVEYGLAGWLLVSDGNDLFGARKFNTPADWWHGFDTNLGQALGSRYKDFQGLFRRDFEHGIVLLNGPGTGPVTVTLPDTFYTLAGDPVDEVVLGPRVGKILLLNPPPKWDWNVLDGPVPPGAQTALGNGSDERATLQNVIDLASPNDVIYFPEPPVAYGVAGNLRIEKPLTMLGHGWLSGSATTDGNFGGAELRQLDNGPTRLLEIASSDVLIDGLRLMGTEYGDGSQRNTSGINVSGLSSKQRYANITIRNSWIQRYRNSGIRVDLAEDVVIDNNRVEDVTFGGIFFVSVDRAQINNNVVEDIGNPEVGSAYHPDTDEINAYPIVVTSDATEEYPHCTNILIQSNIVRQNPVWTGIMNHGGNNVGVFDNEVYNCGFAYALTFSDDNTGRPLASTRTWFVNNYAENAPRNAQWFVGPNEGGSVNHAAIGNVYTSTTDSTTDSIGPIWINNLDGLIFTYNSISGTFDAENRAIRWGQLNSYWDKPILNVSRVGNNLDGGRETFEFDTTHCGATTPEDCILAPPAAVPSVPTNLKAIKTEHGVLLTWINTSGNGHDSFYIEQSLNGITGWTRVAFRPPDDGQWDFGSTNPHWQAFNPLSYLHRGATNGFYRIRAQNGEQTSPWSKAVAVFL